MEHELRAEYEDGSGPGDPAPGVKIWHVVRNHAGPDHAGRDHGGRDHGGLGHAARDAAPGDGLAAMCGRELDPASAARPADDWGTARVPVCHSCGALYLREAP